MEVFFLQNLQKLACCIIVFVISFSTFFASLLENVHANTPFGKKVSEKEEVITKGVTLKTEVYQGNYQRIVANYFKVDPNSENISLQVAMADPINAMAKVTDFAYRENWDGHFVVGSTNASYFETNGYPANLIILNNRIVNFGRLSSNTSNPNYYRYAFGLDANGNPKISSYDLQVNVQVRGKTFSVASMNLDRVDSGVALFTPLHRYQTVGTTPNEYVTEIVVTNASKDPSQFSVGDTITGTISEIIPYGAQSNPTIPQNGFVISAHGDNLASQLADVTTGDAISISASIDPHWMNSQAILQTGPLLVADGKVNISMDVNSTFAKSISPRTAVGVTKDNKLLMVTVDGRQSGYSNGMTINQLANYMVQLGAETAINFDGGGSTAIVAWKPGDSGPRLINRPSDGYERKVPNALQIISTITPIPFSDVSGHWAEKEILSLTDQKIIGGFPDSTFRPNDEITREQAAALLVRLLKIDTTNRKNPNFTDVTKESTFAYNDIAAAVEEGLMVGKKPGIFDPKGKLTRAEAAALLQRAFKLSGSGSQAFPDVPKNHWAYEPIMVLSGNQVTAGYPDGNFKPSKSVTRAEFSVFLYRLMNK